MCVVKKGKKSGERGVPVWYIPNWYMVDVESRLSRRGRDVQGMSLLSCIKWRRTWLCKTVPFLLLMSDIGTGPYGRSDILNTYPKKRQCQSLTPSHCPSALTFSLFFGNSYPACDHIVMFGLQPTISHKLPSPVLATHFVYAFS